MGLAEQNKAVLLLTADIWIWYNEALIKKCYARSGETAQTFRKKEENV